REPEEIDGRGLGIGDQKTSAAVDQIDQREGGGHHPSGGEKGCGGDPVDRIVDGSGELRKALLVEEPCKKRQRGLSGGLPQYRDGYSEQALRVVEAGDIADAAGGVV